MSEAFRLRRDLEPSIGSSSRADSNSVWDSVCLPRRSGTKSRAVILDSDCSAFGSGSAPESTQTLQRHSDASSSLSRASSSRAHWRCALFRQTTHSRYSSNSSLGSCSSSWPQNLESSAWSGGTGGHLHASVRVDGFALGIFLGVTAPLPLVLL